MRFASNLSYVFFRIISSRSGIDDVTGSRVRRQSGADDRDAMRVRDARVPHVREPGRLEEVPARRRDAD